MEFVRFYATGPGGSPLPGATVAVQAKGGGALAPLFLADGTPLANPVRADNAGLVGYAAANGDYDVVVTGTDGVVQPAQRQYLFDPADGAGSASAAASVPGSAAFGSGGLTADDVVGLAQQGEAALVDAKAAADEASQAADALRQQGDDLVAAALQQASQLLADHAARFTTAGLPLGPFTEHFARQTAQAVETIAVMGQVTPDGSAFILNQQGVYWDDGTLLAQKFDQLSSATGALASNLSLNYLTATTTTQAIADAKISLQSYVDNGVGAGLSALSSNLSVNYYTGAETDGRIQSAIASASTTLTSSILGQVNANLSVNYYTATVTDGHITTAVSSARTDLGAQIGGVSTNLTNNYMTAATTTQAIAQAKLDMQSYVDNGVGANLSQNYLTSAQTGSAIASATTNLNVSNSGSLGAFVSSQGVALQSVQGALSGTLAFNVGAGGTTTGLALIATQGGATGQTSLSEVLIRCDDFVLVDGNGAPLFGIDAASKSAFVGTNLNIAGNLNVSGLIDSGAFAGGAVTMFGYQTTTPSSPQPVPQLASSAPPTPGGSGGGGGGGGRGGAQP